MVRACDRAEIAFDRPSPEHAITRGTGVGLEAGAGGDPGVEHVVFDAEGGAD